MAYRLVVDACGNERSYPEGWTSNALDTKQDALDLARWITVETYQSLWYHIVKEEIDVSYKCTGCEWCSLEIALEFARLDAELDELIELKEEEE